MAFDALSSLYETINRLVESSRVSIVSPGREILEDAHGSVMSAAELAESLGKIRNSGEIKRMKALEGEIREAARKLEDAIEIYVSDQYLSQSETESQLSLDLQELRQDIDCLTQKVKKMHELYNPWFDVEEEEAEDQYRVTRERLISWYATKAASTFLGMEEEYIKELENLLPGEEEDDDYAVLLRSTDFSERKLEGRYQKIRDGLMSWWVNKAVSIFVMEEKSIKELDNPPLPEEEVRDDDDDDVVSSSMVGLTDLYFEIWKELIADWEDWGAWYDDDEDDDDDDDVAVPSNRAASIVGMAGIGKTALAKKIFEDPVIVRKFECRIFVRIGQKNQFKEIMQAILAQVYPDGDKMLMDGDEKLDEYLRKTLKGRKVLIVLDDVWKSKIAKYLIRILGDENTGSRVLVTTRLENVARSVAKYGNYRVPFLNNEESWDLLRGKIFAEERCHPELEKAGKKIAEHCEGLPLLILTVADLLSKAEKTPEYWSTVAAYKTNSIFTDAYDQISEVLYPSYDYLPQHIKTCFLYMGVFPQNYEVRLSRLANLWSVEGFFNVPRIRLQGFVEDCFKKFVSSNVVLAVFILSFGICVKKKLRVTSFSIS